MYSTSQSGDIESIYGCGTKTMSWSGLVECARDGVRAMRTVNEYATNLAYREKVDALSQCVGEIAVRLEALQCLPAPGEPSFTLLARDPQAAGLVESWILGREASADGSAHSARKLEDARAVLAAMATWRGDHPVRLRETPAVSGASGGPVEPASL